MVTVHALRKYAADRHNQPLKYLSDHDKMDFESYEFQLLSNPGGIMENLSFIVNSCFSGSDDVIVIGAAPYDIRVPLFLRLANSHNVILHNSWPYWNGDFVPNDPWFNWQELKWEEFIKTVPVVNVTEYATEELKRFGVDATTIPHSVDTDVFTPDKATSRDTRTRVLYVGRLSKRKGVDMLLSIVKSIDASVFEFVFVGDGPLASKIKELQDDYPISYRGYVDEKSELAQIYSLSDIFVLPSRRTEEWEELFGIVLIEAFSSGLPVVTTDCVGPKEIVESGETGFIVNQDRVDELESKLMHLMNEDDVREEMGARAREVAVRKYNVDVVSSQWFDTITDCVD